MTYPLVVILQHLTTTSPSHLCSLHPVLSLALHLLLHDLDSKTVHNVVRGELDLAGRRDHILATARTGEVEWKGKRCG